MTGRRADGFLLLEVILATVLLAIGVGALITSLSRCLAAAQSVQNYTVAQTLLANKSYEFRVERPTDDLDQEGTFEDYPTFSWSRTLEAVGDVDSTWETQAVWREEYREGVLFYLHNDIVRGVLMWNLIGDPEWARRAIRMRKPTTYEEREAMVLESARG